jgi:2-dehydro-3-deoxygluconokinase
MAPPGAVCFGEMLLRLTAPGREALFQSPQLSVCAGGAEANVAVSLARFGHVTSMVTVLPDNPLGELCVGELRRHGVITEHVLRAPGRMGIYFLAMGAAQRPSQIVYDRADSAFALASPDAVNWERALNGAKWLHISGITPALGPRAAEAALKAVRQARKLGVAVSFDCNYRAKLWEASKNDPAALLREFLEDADLAFADDRVLGLILGEDFSHLPAEERLQKAAGLALERLPRLQCVITTIRIEHNVDHHDLSAALVSRTGRFTTRTYNVGPIVDRIGTGDAFAAGILHGRLTGLDDQASLDFALAAAVLKHSIPGDFNLVGVSDVQELLAGRGFAVRR